MNNLKVVEINKTDDYILFDNGVKLYSEHVSDCCEHHWLDFKDLELIDFEDLRFDLSGDKFFKKIEGYGIELMPIIGHSVRIAGYGSNNGFYSTELTLVISDGNLERKFDITECQEINE